MASAIDVISVLGTGISAFSFLQSNLPGMHTEGARVRIFASDGYDASSGEVGNTNTGGRIRNVWGYDAGNRLLGKSQGGRIGAGGQHEFQIQQDNRDQALYIDVVADNDAVCIPVISVTQPANGEEYGWVGDVFKGCGLDNYFGNVDVSGNGDYPRCGWIDANHDNIAQASFKWYLPAFSKQHGGSYSTDRNFYCHPRPLEVRYDAQPIEKRSEVERADRQNRIRRGFRFTELITSPHAQHQASELCEDPTTVGPDFVSLHEGTFCDMSTKTWHRLCDQDSGLLDDCFALDIVNKTLTGVFDLAAASGSSGDLFTYDQITQWR